MTAQLFFGSGVRNTTDFLRFNLGFPQVFDPDRQKFLTYSQNGGFSVARRNGDSAVSASGPNIKFPLVVVPQPRTLDIEDCDCLITTNGQSTDAAATPSDGFVETDAPNAFLTKAAPLPGKLLMFHGGTFPSPNGPGAPATTLAWPLSAYATLRDLVQGTNDGRDPAHLSYRETPGTTSALVVATALPDSSTLLLLEAMAGSRGFTDVTGKTNSIVSASYNSGTGIGTYIVFANCYVQPGQTFTPSNCNPLAWNAGGIVQSVGLDGSGNATIINVAMANPGVPYVGSGTFDDPALQWQNLVNAATYWKNNLIRPGKTARYLAHIMVGHENDSTIGSTAAAIATRYNYLRPKINLLGAFINPDAPVPAFVWPQNGFPRFDHHDSQSRIGELSMGAAQVQEAILRTGLDDRFQTAVTFYMKQDNDVLFNSPHYDYDAEPKFGSKNGHLILDILNDEQTGPPMLNDDFVMITNAPTIINGSVSDIVEFDTTEVTNPGAGGVQIFNAASLSATAVFTEIDASSAVIEGGTTLVATASSTPDPRRLKIGLGYKNATLIRPMINANVTSATWSSSNGGQVTINFDANIDTNIGETLIVFQNANSNWDQTYIACTGTTGTALVSFPWPDPGTWVANGLARAARSADFPTGRAFGLRHTLRATAPTGHYDITSGAPDFNYVLSTIRDVFVRTSVAGFIDQINQIGALYAALITFYSHVYDFGDSGCWSGSGNVVNLGTAGASGNFDTVNAITLVGTPNSKSRNTYALAGANGNLQSSTTTLWANAHKRGAQFGGTVVFLFKAGANAIYLGGTCLNETSSGANGAVFLISATSNIPGIRVRKGSNVLIYSLNSSVACVDGQIYIVEFYVKDSADGTTPGAAFIRVNGVLTTDTHVIFASPSAGSAQSLFTIGVNGTGGTRKLVAGTQIFMAGYGQSGGPFTYDDWLPQYNSINWRQSGLPF